MPKDLLEEALNSYANRRPYIETEGSVPLDKVMGIKQPLKPKTPEQMAAQACRDRCNEMNKKPKV